MFEYLPDEMIIYIMSFMDLLTLKNFKCVDKHIYNLFWDKNFSKYRWIKKIDSMIENKPPNQILKWATSMRNREMICYIIELSANKKINLTDTYISFREACRKRDECLMRIFGEVENRKNISILTGEEPHICLHYIESCTYDIKEKYNSKSCKDNVKEKHKSESALMCLKKIYENTRQYYNVPYSNHTCHFCKKKCRCV